MKVPTLLAVARHRGTEISNPFPSSKESANHRFPRARQVDRRSDEASKPKPYLRAVLQVRIHLPPARRVALLRSRVAAVGESAVAGLETQGFVAVRHRLLKLVNRRPGKASVVEGDGVMRVERDRLVEVLDGAVVLALVAVSATANGPAAVRASPLHLPPSDANIRPRRRRGSRQGGG